MSPVPHARSSTRTPGRMRRHRHQPPLPSAVLPVREKNGDEVVAIGDGREEASDVAGLGIGRIERRAEAIGAWARIAISVRRSQYRSAHHLGVRRAAVGVRRRASVGTVNSMLSCPLPLRRRVLTRHDRITKSCDMPTSVLLRTMRMRSPGRARSVGFGATLPVDVESHVPGDELDLANGGCRRRAPLSDGAGHTPSGVAPAARAPARRWRPRTRAQREPASVSSSDQQPRGVHDAESREQPDHHGRRRKPLRQASCAPAT